MAGKTLATWLEDNNKTQAWLGEQLAMSQTGVSNVVRGKDTRFDTLRSIYKITDGEVTPNWMILGKAA